MRKYIFYFTTLALIMFFATCSNQQIFGEKEISTEKEGVISLKINMPEDVPITRVALEQEKYMGVALTWEKGDQLELVFVKGDIKIKQTVVVGEISSDFKNASFDIIIPSEITGNFDLYGVYGGGGLSVDIPTLAVLPKSTSDSGLLNLIQEKKDVMLYFASKDIKFNALVASVNFEHLGSLIGIIVKNTSSETLVGLKEMRLTGIGEKTNWAYNNGAGGKTYNLVTGEFEEINSGGNYISFNTTDMSISAGDTKTFWCWAPMVGKTWPKLKLEAITPDNNVYKTSTNTKPAATNAYTAGKVYYYGVEWDGENVEFKDVEVPVEGLSIKEEIFKSLSEYGFYSILLNYLEKTTLPADMNSATMLLLPDNILKDQKPFNLEEYIIGKSMPLINLIGQKDIFTLANTNLETLSIGQEVLINGSKVIKTFSKLGNQFIVLDNVFTSSISGKEFMSVKKVGDELYISSKFTDKEDLLILFRKSMYNNLMTFNRIGYINNSDQLAVKNPQQNPTVVINQTSSDNIGPISILGGGWAGGNHSHREKNKIKTAKEISFQFIADGKIMPENEAIYAKKIEVTVKNIIYDPRVDPNENEDFLTTQLCIEDVTYTVEKNNIKVDLSHNSLNEEPATVSVYYGMQSMTKGDQIFFPNGHTSDFIQKINDISGKKNEFPYFSRFIQRKLVPEWYEAAFLLPSVGMGNHSLIPDNQVIYLVSGGKTYHRIMAGVKASKGDSYRWSGIYTWFKPIIDNEYLLAYEMRMDGKNIIMIDLKKSFDGILNLPIEYIDKPYNILEKGENISSVEIVFSKGLSIKSKGKGSMILQF